MTEPDYHTLRGLLAIKWPAGEASYWKGLEIFPLAGDASSRRYWRLQYNNSSAVLLWGPEADENSAYFNIGRHLRRAGLPVPEILGRQPENSGGPSWFLLEDLGAGHVFDCGPAEGCLELYLKSATVLAAFHEAGAEDFELNWCHQTKYYDKSLIVEKEIGYFLEHLVAGKCGLVLTDRRKQTILAEGESLAGLALSGDSPLVLMHRDFQSKNLMVKDDKPYIIDWQGARLGPWAYDLASLIYDPYAPWVRPWKKEIITAYLAARKNKPASNGNSLELLAACRLMQALGAYGKLSAYKAYFAQYIPQALKDLARLFKKAPLSEYAALAELIAECEEITELNK